MVPATAQAQSVPALGSVLSSCNSASYTAGQNRPVTMDTAGNLCTDALLSPSGTQDVNIKQVGGSTVTAGNGATAAGTMRVTISNDSTGVVGLNAGTALIGKAGIDQTTPGTTNGVVVNSSALPTGASSATNQTTVQAPVSPASATATKSVLGGVQAIASGTSTMTAGQQGFQPVDLFGSTPVLNKDTSGAAIDYTQNISINPYCGGCTAITGNATGTTGAVVGTLAGTSGKTTYICGLTVDAVGGVATIGPITVAGLTGSSMVFQLFSSATGNHLPNPFNVCIPASATNTAITVTTTADGTATAVDVNSWGFQL